MSSPQITRMLGGLSRLFAVFRLHDFAVFTLFAVFAMSLLLLVREAVSPRNPAAAVSQDGSTWTAQPSDDIARAAGRVCVEPVKDQLGWRPHAASARAAGDGARVDRARRSAQDRSHGGRQHAIGKGLAGHVGPSAR